ncbi:MAG: hypothetical protein LUE96_11545 [Lachnospiraceae bacterium]|nr:hypothetical protein [Lachnospiraceae bacterium]
MRRWFIRCLSSSVIIVLVMAAAAWIIDPYFHFHKPFSFLSYRLYDERYTNDGISRHFDYDAIITGTSMAQNFKTSEADELFGAKFVKETFSGAGFKELSQKLTRALARNGDLKTVIWSVDYNAILRDRDYDIYEGYPEYLYDDNPLNDVNYIFNKAVWYEGILPNLVMTLTGQESTTMDEYSSWDKELGYECVMAGYERWEERAEMSPGLSDEEREMVAENIRQNLVEPANAYPDTTFYLFYTPYSICYWDYLNQEGLMLRQLEAEQIATELLLQCPNVRLYNFNDRYDIITDFDNYRDREHYGAHINSRILEWLAQGEGVVTADNYLELLEQEKNYYLNYDYEEIFNE